MKQAFSSSSVHNDHLAKGKMSVVDVIVPSKALQIVWKHGDDFPWPEWGLVMEHLTACFSFFPPGSQCWCAMALYRQFCEPFICFIDGGTVPKHAYRTEPSTGFKIYFYFFSFYLMLHLLNTFWMFNTILMHAKIVLDKSNHKNAINLSVK